MFVYLRYFYAVSLVLVIVGGLLIGHLIRSMTAEGLGSLIREHDEALAAQYISAIWQPYYPASQPGPERFDQLQIFRAASGEFTKHLPKLRLRVFNRSDKVVYDSSGVQLLDAGQEDIAGYRHRYGLGLHPVSRIVQDVLWRQDKRQSMVTVVQTLIPIPNPDYAPETPICKSANVLETARTDVCRLTLGVIEIVSDISAQWADLRRIQIITTASIIGIFILLISILFLTTQRAESIIARQHEANMELISAASAAEAENRDKSQFLANISHELRTPLNAIIGFSEIIKNEAMGNLEQTHQAYIRDIHSSGKHLLSLINDILDYSKAEAGKLELALAEVDLSKLIVNSMRLVIPRAEEAQVTLVEDLPEEHIICTTDGKKLKQVILNLLSNAVKFTPAGGEVRVSAWQKLLDGRISIQVKDSGIGIAPKDIAKVMSPFGQVESNLSRRYEGTGLGLPLSKKFVEIMGGEFHIESVVDKGTTITITLPGPKQEEGSDFAPRAEKKDQQDQQE